MGDAALGAALVLRVLLLLGAVGQSCSFGVGPGSLLAAAVLHGKAAAPGGGAVLHGDCSRAELQLRKLLPYASSAKAQNFMLKTQSLNGLRKPTNTILSSEII